MTAREAADTFLADDRGLELIAFASGGDTGITWLPRARVMSTGPRWVPLDAPHPLEAEALARPLARPAPGARPANVVAVADGPARSFSGGHPRALGATAGSRQSGLNHLALAPGGAAAPHHCHALDEERFTVLDWRTLRASPGDSVL